MENLFGKKILVVDDSATMRMLIVMLLKKNLPGISVSEAVNGADASGKLSEGKFDMVLTDMQMPEMDGAGLVKWIRSSIGPSLPVVIITTKGEEKDRDFGLSLGANGYITKPVNAIELKKAVIMFLSETKA